MGNSSSQAVQLRTPQGLLTSRDSRNRKLNKYVNAENRVLPAPVAGQRLRATDNGSILHNGGTISGRKLAMLQAQQQHREQEESHSDFEGALKPSSGRGRQGDSGRDTLYGHRKSHSDPDIVRSMHQNSMAEEDSSDSGPQQLRSIIAESPSKAKIRWRKKGRAPDPPALSSTLPRELDRMPMYEERARPRSKSPAPLPPAAPPPPQDNPAVGYEKNKRWRPLQDGNNNALLHRTELLRKSFVEAETANHPKKEAQNKSFNAKLDAKIKPLNRSFQEEILAAAKRKSQSLKQQVLSKGREEVYKSPGHQKTIETNNRDNPAWEKCFGTKEVVQRVSGNKSKEQPRIRNDNFVLRRTEEMKRYDEDGRITGDLWNRGKKDEPKRYFFANPVKQESKKQNAQRQRLNNLNQPNEMRQRSDDECEWPAQQPRQPWELLVREPHAWEGAKEMGFKEIARETAKVIVKESIAREVVRGRPTRESSKEQLFKEGRPSEMTKEPVTRELSKDPLSREPLSKHTSREIVRAPLSRELSRETYTTDKTKELLSERQLREIQLEDVARMQLERDPPIREIPRDEARDAQEVSRERWLSENRSFRGSSRSSRFSSCSSSSDKEEEDGEKAIGVQLRAVLPRKNVAMPQFSPTQAWKNITLETPTCYSTDISGSSSSSDAEAVEEELILKVHRPVAPRRSFPERCADSGISPDAGSPLPIHEVMPRRRPGVGRAATPPEEHWTPQQDLLDDSDVGSVQDHRWMEPPVISLHAKLTLPNGMFVNRQLESALPPIKPDQDKSKSRNRRRNNKQSSNENGQQFNSLRSLKKVLRLRSKSMEENTRGLDSNWSLSRSTPTIAAPDAVPRIYKDLQRSPSESALHEVVQEELNTTEKNSSALYHPEYDSSPNLGQDAKPKKKSKKGSKFSYQNTFRREAKKKLEEKVSREAVEKERRREEEIQWMNKVEEEFRKRRDREKINIRYQLKILSDEETTLDSSGDWQPQSPKPESRSLPSNKNHHVEVHTPSSTSTNSPDLHPIWNNNPQTGMSKWLKKQPAGALRPAYSRPEPEGGRSSGDEFRSREDLMSSDVKSKKNNDNYNRVSCDEFTFGERPQSKVIKGYSHEEHSNSEDNLFDETKKSTRYSTDKTNVDLQQDYKERRSSYELNDSRKSIEVKVSGRYSDDQSKAEGYRDRSNSYDDGRIREVQESRVKSNRASEDQQKADIKGYRDRSNSYEDARTQAPESRKKPNIYKHLSAVAELEEQRQKADRAVPNTMLPFSSEGFQSELLARIQDKTPQDKSSQDNFSRGHPHRSGGRMPRPLTSAPTQTPVQQRNGKAGPVLQLSPVTPFAPSKGYRHVPFDVVSPGKRRSQNNSSPLCADARNLAVEAR